MKHYTPLFGSVRHSGKLADLPDDHCRLFYFMLLAQCDAWGRVDGRTRVLNAEVWPLLGKSAIQTECCLSELYVHQLVALYCDDKGRSWVQIPDWEDKAGSVGKRDHRKESRFPAPDETLRAIPGQGGPVRANAGQTGPDRAIPRACSAIARARSPQPKPKPEIEPKPQPELEPEPQLATLARGRGNTLTRKWDELWNREHLGEPFAWVKADAIALAHCLKLAGGDEAELFRRMEAIACDPDDWVQKNLNPRLLLKRWNGYTATQGLSEPQRVFVQQKLDRLNGHTPDRPLLKPFGEALP